MYHTVKTETQFTAGGRPLVYNFDKAKKLEIQTKVKRPFGGIRKTWFLVTPNVFRSFHGTRRVDGTTFKGTVFYFNSNQEYGTPASRKVKVDNRHITLTVVRAPKHTRFINIRFKSAR